MDRRLVKLISWWHEYLRKLVLLLGVFIWECGSIRWGWGPGHLNVVFELIPQMLNVEEGIIVTFLHHFFVKESLPILDLSHCQVAFLYLREQLRVSLINLIVAKVFLKYWWAMVAAIWWNLLLELRIVIEQRFLEFLLQHFVDLKLLQLFFLNFF